MGGSERLISEAHYLSETKKFLMVTRNPSSSMSPQEEYHGDDDVNDKKIKDLHFLWTSMCFQEQSV